jgi:MFS family permease
MRWVSASHGALAAGAGWHWSMRRLHALPRGLLTFAAAAVAAGTARAVVTTYLPVLLDEVRSSPGIIGTVMIVNAATGFGVPLVVGAWSDRAHAGARGRRMPFIIGGCAVAVAGLAGIALGAGVSILALTAAGTVAYVGINALTTAHRALVPELFDQSGRARATGAQEVALLLGSMVGLVGGGIATELGSWAPFALAALAVPLLAAPTVATVREPARPVTRDAVSPAADYARLLRFPGVRALLGAQVLWMLGYAAVPAFFVLYAEKVLDLSPPIASVLLAGFGVVTGITMVRAGAIRDAARYVPVLCVGVVLLGGGFLGIAASPSVSAMVPGLVAAAVGFGLLATIGFPLLTALAPAGEEGEYTGLYFSVRAIASGVALPVAGWTIAATDSYRALFWFGGAVALLALVPLVTAGRSAGMKWRRSL